MGVSWVHGRKCGLIHMVLVDASHTPLGIGAFPD